MREIKLNDVEYLRGKIISASVDEEQLEFKNGVALAKASITSRYYGGTKEYECYGLIDEEFNEVYDDDEKKSGNDFRATRNLMFIGYNIDAYRFQENDFIIGVSCQDDALTWKEYRHVRIVDGAPTRINILYNKPVATSVLGVVISGGTLYDINNGKVVASKLTSISEAENQPGVFDVTARIVLEQYKGRYELVDYLFFKIDSTGKIVSRVLSSLENGYLEISPEVSVEDLIENRTHYLQEREVQFGEELSEFRKCIDTTTKGSAGHVMKMQPIDKNNQ